MRIKELEKLHPAAFQLAKENTERFKEHYEINSFLGSMFLFYTTKQKAVPWEDLYFLNNVLSMNEWIRANIPDLIDLIPKEDENKDKE